MTQQTTLATAIKSWNNDEQPTPDIDAQMIIQASNATLIASFKRPDKTTSKSSIMLENTDGHPAFRIYHDSESDNLIGTISEITDHQSRNFLKATFEQAITINLTNAHPYPPTIDEESQTPTIATNKPGQTHITTSLEPWDNSTTEAPKFSATLDIQDTSITLSTIFSRPNNSKGQISIMLENDCGSPKFRIYHDSETDELIGTIKEIQPDMGKSNRQLQLVCDKQIAVE